MVSADSGDSSSKAQYAKPVRVVPPTAVASVRPLPPAPSFDEEEEPTKSKGDLYLVPKNEEFPPFKSATLKRRVPPPVPNTPRPVLFNGCATVGRAPKNKSTFGGIKEPLSTSPSFPLMAKQVAQVHRGPEKHSTGTLLRIHDKYIKPGNTRENNQQQQQPLKSSSQPTATAAVVGQQQKKPFASLDSETLLAVRIFLIYCCFIYLFFSVYLKML